MSRTGDYIIELMDKGEWIEDQIDNDYSPHDFATAQDNWDEVFGKCVQLVYRALDEQSGTSESMNLLYWRAESFAVDVIAHKRELTIEEAYAELGYEMKKTEDFCTGDAVPF